MMSLPDIDLDTLINWLVRICKTPSPTGDTQAALELVAEWLRGLGLQPSFTRKGALVVTLPGRKSSAPRAITAHMDTLGAIVNEIKPNGRLAFDRIGSYQLYSVNGEYCQVRTADNRVVTGTAVLVKSSAHVYREPVQDKEWKAEEMEIRLDALTTSARETRALGIEVGDLIAWDPRTTVTDTGYVKSRHLDDKAGVAVMLAALKSFVDSGLAPVQRTTFHKIPYNVDIFPYYGSDAEAAVRAGGDYRIGLLGPGVDASHSFERTHRDALDASTRLLLAYLLAED